MKISINRLTKVSGSIVVTGGYTIINEDVKELLERLSTKEAQIELSHYEKAIVKQVRKKFQDLEVIPPEEFQSYEI